MCIRDRQCGIQILMITAPVYFIYVAIEVLSGTVRGAGASFIPVSYTRLDVYKRQITSFAIKSLFVQDRLYNEFNGNTPVSVLNPCSK